MNYWLVKTEPETFSWEQLVEKKSEMWDGVRNYQARNNLAAMKKNDIVLVYHSGKNKEVVGIAKVAKEHYPDPTTKEKGWVVVDLKADKVLKKPVSLALIKQQEDLKDMLLVRNARLSVMPLTPYMYERIIELSHL